MATKIMIEVPDGLSETEKSDLRLLLADALSEFQKPRTLAELYVVKRYAGVFSPKETLNKIEQVKRRVLLAQKLHSAVFDVKVEDVADAPVPSEDGDA